jgi:menaquinone-9 beta-reductase
VPSIDSGSNFDVVIAGAGPGGTAAACALLARAPQLRVLLVDKSDFPRDKCCGDGLGPGVVDVMRRLGLSDVVENENPITGCTILGPGGVELDAELPRIDGRVVTGYVVPRTQLDDRLYRAAIERGATAMLGRVEQTWMDGDRRAVEISTAEGTQTVRTRLAIGADGASSRVRKSLGQARSSDRMTGIAVRAYVEIISAPHDGARRLLFEFNERLLPAYAWYFPGSGSTANIGLGVTVHDHQKRKLDLKAMLVEFCVVLRERGFVLGEPTMVRTYTLPLATKLPQLAHERAVLIGDAASMINPVSGEGIFYAMAAGEMVGDRLGLVVASDLDPSAALAGFERAFRQRFVRHYRSNAAAQWMLRSQRWSRLAIRAAARDEKVLVNAVQLLFGEGAITVSSSARLLMAGLIPNR